MQLSVGIEMEAQAAAVITNFAASLGRSQAEHVINNMSGTVGKVRCCIIFFQFFFFFNILLSTRHKEAYW